MKKFLQIFLKNLIPSKEFCKGVIAMLASVIILGIPLYFLAQYALPHNYWMLPLAFAIEYYIFIVAIQSWMEYKRSTRK